MVFKPANIFGSQKVSFFFSHLLMLWIELDYKLGIVFLWIIFTKQVKTYFMLSQNDSILFFLLNSS